MPDSPTPPDALTRWCEEARPLFVVTLTFARHLGSAVRHGDPARAVGAADLFLKETSDGAYRLLVDSCPEQEAGPELGAALAVFRNAAWVCRRLTSEQEARPQLVAACVALLEQGAIHLDRAIKLMGIDTD